MNGFIAAGPAGRNPYAVNNAPAAPRSSNGGGNPYAAAGTPQMAQSSSNFNVPATANYDYEKAAGAGECWGITSGVVLCLARPLFSHLYHSPVVVHAVGAVTDAFLP